jgi:protein-L-isoaspartate O-methyltransferase
MNPTKDYGGQYLDSLGLHPVRDTAELARQLEQAVGRERGQLLLRTLEDRQARQRSGTLSRRETAEFYQLKNRSPQAGIILSAAHDWELLRRTCNWVAEHREAFGEAVLDVGCDCGLLSCFLAQLIPSVQITSIDRSGNAIAAARGLARQLGLSNITFRHGDLETLPQAEYDTVFSSRTVQENYDPLEENARFLLLTRQGRICAQVFRRYTGLLTGFIRPGGSLVTVERMERDRVFLGYCLALNGWGMDLIPESHQELLCREGERTTALQAFCAVKEGRTDAVAAEDFFISGFQDRLTWQPEHLDTEGELILELCAQELLWGVFLHTAKGARVGKLAVYTSKYDPEELFYYQGIIGQSVRVHRCSREALKDVMALLEADLVTLTGSGLSAHPFRFQAGEEQLTAPEDGS